MERWKEAFHGQIPEGKYETELINGEEKGLILKLSDANVEISLYFGYVRAMRMLDEGIVQELYDGEELEQFKCEGFRNVIYEIENGEFECQIKKMADGMWSTFVEPVHYRVITQNYNIDIIAEAEPKLEIHPKTLEKTLCCE